MASETIAAEHHEGHGPGHLHHHFDDLEQQRECTSLVMWSFLATEIMMFGGLFFAYSLYRMRFTEAFHIGSHHLDITLGTINTFVLLFSSLTMALAVHAAAESNPRGTAFWLVLTWLLGASFIGVKAIEWTKDYHEGIVPAVMWNYPHHFPQDVEKLAAGGVGPQHVMMYFVIYFCMTGLHALHMIVGLLLVGAFIWYAKRGQFTNGNDQPVEILGLYWHFVDIVWIFLFPLLYLIAGFGGAGH
jgi:cytochrome c oxidase subunit III